MKKCFLAVLVAVSTTNPATAQSPVARLERTQYQGRAAYRLSNGVTDAVVVPSLGRLMRYGFVGGPNWLWNAPHVRKSDVYKNVGGDKTWPAPQLAWRNGGNWPPDAVWDGGPHRAQVLSGARLRTTSGLWREFGLRLVREYSFARNGDFLITQTFVKESGAPRLHAIWNVTQVQPEAVFLPTNSNSAYRNGYHWYSQPHQDELVSILPGMLQVVSSKKVGYKIGVDAPVAAIAAVKNGVVFLERAPRPQGDYPDGAIGAGFPVQLYDSGGDNAREHFTELELTSPLRPFRKGSRWTHTLRWSLHRLPSTDWQTPAARKVIEDLLLKSG
jgi:hypothetical protein